MNEPDARAAQARPRTVATAAAWLVTVALVAVYLLRASEGHIGYTPFTDRDLVRASDFWTLPTSGAELSNGVGARVPGALLAFVMWLPRVVDDRPEAVFAFQVGLAAAGLLWLHAIVGRRFGPLAAVLSVATLAGSFPFLDTTRTLWNPGFLPLFAVMMVDGVDRVVGAKRAGSVVEVAAGAALGGQLHLSAWLAGAATVPSLLLSRAPRLLRALPWALAAVALCYLPFLVDEALHGFRATRLLLLQDVVRGRGLGRTASERLGAELGMLVGDPVRDLHTPLDAGVATAIDAVNTVGALVALTVGVGALVAVARRRASPGVQVLAAHAATGALVVGWYAADASLSVFARYLLAITPGLAVLVGVGLARLPVALARFGRAGAAVGFAVAVGLTAVRALPLAASFPPSERDWLAVQASLASLRQETGWSLPELTGRTAWVDRGPDGALTLEATGLAVHDLLRREGADFPGSLPGPCAAVVTDRGQAHAPPDGATVATFVGGPTATPTHVVELGHGRWLVRYQRAEPRCPTTMGQRFLDRPAEQDVRALYGTLPCGEVREVSADGPRRFVVFGGRPQGRSACRHLGMAVDLTAAAGRVDATLESNQLRGGAENTGWYFTSRVQHPRVVLIDDAGAETELLFDPGLVGLGHAVTPLRATATVPPGRYAVDLDLTVVADTLSANREPQGEPRAMRVRLTDAFDVR